MRMWGIEPKMLCNKHLLGEHVEMHMFRGTIIKGIKVDGYIENGLVVLGKIKERHDIIAAEMVKRKMNHKTPLNKFEEGVGGKINISNNIEDIRKRCKECNKLHLISKEINKQPNSCMRGD